MIIKEFQYERPETLASENPNDLLARAQLESVVGLKNDPIEFSTDVFDLFPTNSVERLFSTNDPTSPPVGVSDNFQLNSYYNNPYFNSFIVTVVNNSLTAGDINVDTTRYVIFKCLAPGTSHTVSTVLGGDFESPIAGTISAIGAWVDTAGTTGTATIDVNIGGTTIMTTNKITIDTTEKTSRTAATTAVLTTTTLAVGDIITVDIDVVQTTPAKGLTVRLTID